MALFCLLSIEEVSLVYKSFFVMLGLACAVPIKHLIRHAKHLVGLFVTSFVLMSKSEYPPTVNLGGY